MNNLPVAFGTAVPAIKNREVTLVPFVPTARSTRRRKVLLCVGILLVVMLVAWSVAEANRSRTASAAEKTAQEQTAIKFLMANENGPYGTAWDLLSTRARGGDSRESYAKESYANKYGDPATHWPKVTNVFVTRMDKPQHGYVNVYLRDEWDDGSLPLNPVVRLVKEGTTWRVDNYSTNISDSFNIPEGPQ